MTSTDIIWAYRHLLRASLQAVRFSTPARYQIRDILRESFRELPSTHFQPRRIVNTLQFIQRASEHTGIEHRILRNILHIRFWRAKKLENPLHVSLFIAQYKTDKVQVDATDYTRNRCPQKCPLSIRCHPDHVE